MYILLHPLRVLNYDKSDGRDFRSAQPALTQPQHKSSYVNTSLSACATRFQVAPNKDVRPPLATLLISRMFASKLKSARPYKMLRNMMQSKLFFQFLLLTRRRLYLQQKDAKRA